MFSGIGKSSYFLPHIVLCITRYSKEMQIYIDSIKMFLQ